jgi:hypothetical protein
MNKGSRAAAPMSKPAEGKKDTSKPAGGKVVPSMMPAGRTRKRSQKRIMSLIKRRVSWVMDTIDDDVPRPVRFRYQALTALMMQAATQKLSDVLAKMIPYDTTGEIQYLYQNALSRGN